MHTAKKLETKLKHLTEQGLEKMENSLGNLGMSDKEKEANGIPIITTITIEPDTDTSLKLQTSTDSIRKALFPLGVIARCFGLLPCYEIISFTFPLPGGTKCPKKRIIHYMYSGFILGFIISGLAICIFHTPAVLEGMAFAESTSNKTDSFVIMGVFYTSIGMGILTLLTIPRKTCAFMSYIKHFENVDKILQFGKHNEEREKKFGQILAIFLFLAVLVLILIYTGLFIFESPEIEKTYLDYIMVIVESFAEMASLTPTCLIIFFLHSIKLRLEEFNRQIEQIILPITPSCVSCVNYSDYGNELVGQVCYRKSNLLGEDLEKMRILHEEIGVLADKTSEIFGSHLIRDFLYATIGMILYSYFILFVRGVGLKYWFIFPFLDIFIVIKLVCISSCAHMITKQVRKLYENEIN